MLEDLESYVDHLMVTEAENASSRSARCKCRSNRIFVYNTLTAIKFLIWQNEQEAATQAIESFVQLLRHTFNRKEIVPLKDELAIVEEYLVLMNVRYGNRIQSTIFQKMAVKIFSYRKWFLQPIIENAYLHAFPEEDSGLIQIFSRQ